ncbi:hypothetical protein JX265_006587 [Neoarthrinium moseri]|uniref:Uncharacterized protein n=1 Tax=Neoarthrinium moseri TaxID=1658444 RepID=A0A9Q0AP15_9PEZI|nr:hypothetical protein JX265_006587 [Neoarthrinium moseri]
MDRYSDIPHPRATRYEVPSQTHAGDMGRHLRLPRPLNSENDPNRTQPSDMGSFVLPVGSSKTPDFSAGLRHDFTGSSIPRCKTDTEDVSPSFAHSKATEEVVQADSFKTKIPSRRDGQDHIPGDAVFVEHYTNALHTPGDYLYDHTNVVFNFKSSLPSHLIHRALGDQLIAAMESSSNTWPTSVCHVHNYHREESSTPRQAHQSGTIAGLNCLVQDLNSAGTSPVEDSITRNSRAYHGNLYLERNRDADIPDEENCRLWLTGIPPETHYGGLLSFRNAGPIYASHLTEPQLYTRWSDGKEVYSRAASITFFRAEDANRFLLAHQDNNLRINGWMIDMRRHRIRTRSMHPCGRSRVLLIKGDPAVVHPRALDLIIRNVWRIYYDVDFLHYEEWNGCGKLVIAFGSFRAQAQQVAFHLQTAYAQQVVIEYLDDPCASK